MGNRFLKIVAEIFNLAVGEYLKLIRSQGFGGFLQIQRNQRFVAHPVLIQVAGAGHQKSAAAVRICAADCGQKF